MPGQTGTAPATSDPRTVGLRIGLAIGAIGTLLLLLGVGTALMPNQVNVDTRSNEDIFFDCGLTMFPTVRPHEEPGVSACGRYTEDMQRTALYLFTGGSVALAVGGSAVYRSSRRRGSLTHPPKD